MYTAKTERRYRDRIKTGWRGGPTLLAFLFAAPDTGAIKMLDARGDYFDLRTGNTWDLFFPGYYRSHKGILFEREAGALPIGDRYANDWFFSAADFNELREHVEMLSRHLWEYSGGADLVLVNGWLPPEGEPTIDWASTISGQITDQVAGAQTLTLAHVVERITRDLETGNEDSAYGVGEITDGPAIRKGPRGEAAREFMVEMLAKIAADLGSRALGF
jgi:hypothetical protein